MSNKYLRNHDRSPLASVALIISLSVGLVGNPVFADDFGYGPEGAAGNQQSNSIMPTAGFPSLSGQSGDFASADSGQNAASSTAPSQPLPAAQPAPAAENKPAAQKSSSAENNAGIHEAPAVQSKGKSPATAAPGWSSKSQAVQPKSNSAGGKSAAGASRPVVKRAVNTPAQDDLLREIFALTEKPRTQESMDKIFATEKEAQAYLDKGDNLKALSKFQDLYALCKEVKYGDGEGRALERMAFLYLSKGEKTRAKSLIENSMEVLSSSQDRKSLGHTRVTAAQVYLALDNPVWALRQLDEAMKDFSSSSLMDNEEAAKAMLLAAELAVKTDQPKEAVKFYTAAAIHFGQSGNHIFEVNLHNTVSGMLQEMGLNTAAMEEAVKAVSISRDLKNQPLLAASLTELASCQYALCEFMSARKSLEEAQSFNLTNQFPGGLAVTTEAYGFALASTGLPDQALAALEKAWSVFKQSAPAIHKTQVLNALGVLNSLKGNYQTAVEQLRQAADINSVVGKNREKYSFIIFQNIASALSRAGENRKAKAELESVLRLMAKCKDQDQQILAQVYCALGEICLQLKEIPQSDAYFKKSIEVASKINDDATLWRDYVNLAKLQIGLQQNPCETLASAASCFRSPQAGVFFVAERNPFPSTRDELSSELVSMLISNNMIEQAFITAEQIKEEGFINEWQKNGGEVKPSDREIYDDLVVQAAHLHAAENTSTPDKTLKQWQEWMRRHQILAAENRELARLISPVPINLKELAAKAADNQSTLLDYMIGPKQSFVFVIDRSGKLAAVKLAAGREQLKAQVNSVLTLSARSGPENRLAEKRLLQILLNELLPEQVAKLLPQNPDQLVIFVPDAVLFNLPVAALVDPQGRYLIESHTLTTLPAVYNFLDNGAAYGTDQSLVFNASTDLAESREALEASELSSIFQPDQLIKLIGKNADTARLTEQARANAVLHFSGPLLLQDQGSLKSQLPMTLEGNPDKKVTAENLFKLNLPSDLAVWSGVTVNPKDSQGGGVKVFSRGLAYAGVRNVLLSLWVEQNPQRTEELLEFYRGRQQGLNQVQSLRKAQLLALSKDPAPRSWAAFELIGLGH